MFVAWEWLAGSDGIGGGPNLGPWQCRPSWSSDVGRLAWEWHPWRPECSTLPVGASGLPAHWWYWVAAVGGLPLRGFRADGRPLGGHIILIPCVGVWEVGPHFGEVYYLLGHGSFGSLCPPEASALAVWGMVWGDQCLIWGHTVSQNSVGGSMPWVPSSSGGLWRAWDSKPLPWDGSHGVGPLFSQRQVSPGGNLRPQAFSSLGMPCTQQSEEISLVEWSSSWKYGKRILHFWITVDFPLFV